MSLLCLFKSILTVFRWPLLHLFALPVSMETTKNGADDLAADAGNLESSGYYVNQQLKGNFDKGDSGKAIQVRATIGKSRRNRFENTRELVGNYQNNMNDTMKCYILDFGND